MNSITGNTRQTQRVGQAKQRARQPVGNQSKSNCNIAALPTPFAASNLSLAGQNAPTSLANLAQLSGITLVPMGSKATPPAGRQPSLAKFAAPQAAGRPASSKASSSGGQPSCSLYNLAASKASAQLLGRSGQPDDYDEWQAAFTGKASSFSAPAQLAKKSPKPKGNPRRKQHSNLMNDLPVIATNESMSLYSDFGSDVAGNITIDDAFSAQPTRDSLIADDQAARFDDDPNNISLMKLMAVLNNPALTITAVNPTNPLVGRLKSATNGYLPSSLADNQRSKSSSSSTYSHEHSAKSQPISETFQSDPFLPRPKAVSTKSRIPKSAANLQVLSASLKNEKNQTPDPNLIEISLATEPKLKTPIPKQSEVQLNWISSATANTSSNKQSAPTAWPKELKNSTPSTNELGNSSSEDNEPTSVALSTSVKNLLMQHPSANHKSAVSVQLLKHIASQAKDNDWTPQPLEERHPNSVLEPECVLSIPKEIPQFKDGVKRQRRIHVVYTTPQSNSKGNRSLSTSKHRLYVPRSSDKPTINNLILPEVKIEDHGTVEEYLSEQHFILDRMMHHETQKRQKGSMPEPDDIFVNRSKRVMSYIDTMVERKKRKRFERISGRSDPKTNSLQEQCAESDAEFEEGDIKSDLASMGFIKTQLPLEEEITDAKRNHLLSVNLVSRSDRNRLLVEQIKNRQDIVTPLASGSFTGPSEGMIGFVEAIKKTGGEDIQLRTETNIKRNDLPLIEGLNRNSSRLKMSYMAALGLDKRSKRTTLYKVKTNETPNLLPATGPVIDLKPIKSIVVEKTKVIPEAPKKPLLSPSFRAIPTNQIAFVSCREAMKTPSKDEYMKFLGLTAS